MRALKVTTIFDIAVLLLVAGLVALDRAAIIWLSDSGEKLLALAITCLVMLFGGAVSPRLPFNRHTGLRLPWTVQDEQTWNVAHRSLGVISLPLVLLYLAACFTIPNFKAISLAVLLLWIGIPGLLSLLFWWRKFHG